MKATGVVRRIDDLGRIVIPKEIRKTLRIKEGTPLEIFTEKEGDIILKKYSPIGELTNFSESYVDSLSSVTKCIAIVTDKDSVIAVSGTSKKDLLEQPISEKLEKIIDKREIFVGNPNNFVPIITRNNYDNYSEIIVPIISYSEVIGCIILLSKELNLSNAEIQIAKVAANFLGTQMEIWDNVLDKKQFT